MTSLSTVADGEQLKREALNLLEEHRKVWVRRGRRALLMKLLVTGTATADVVHAAVKLPPGVDPRCLGSVPGLLALKGIIRRVGFAQSNRPECHRTTVTVWELVDRAAAMAWLEDNPDMPDLDGNPEQKLLFQ